MISTPVSATAPAARSAFGENVLAFIKRIDDGRLLRGVFYALLAGVAATLVIDYRELANRAAFERIAPGTGRPVLPPHIPSDSEPGEGIPGAPRPAPPAVTTPPDALRQEMQITLGRNGVLSLTGAIGLGTAAAFDEKTADIGEYIQIVELDSPGGSVEDALAIAKAIRNRGFDTRVKSGSLCASSCPLVLAGGVNRFAPANAAIGVHQIFSMSEDYRSNQEAVAGTQSVTAEITRHLDDMGADPALWLHALDTPPQKLYYFSPEELEKYRLVTELER